MAKKPKPPKRPKPAANGHAAGMFRPRERLIYQYHDGQKNRLGDPLHVVRMLTNFDGFVLDVDAKLAIGTTPEAPAALGRLIGAIRGVFGIRPLEDGGLTEGECLALLHHFMKFIEGVQKDADPLLRSRDATASPAANGSATASSSPSGSDAAAP